MAKKKAVKKSKPAKPAKKMRVIKYWLAANQHTPLGGSGHERTRKRKEAFELWKGDKSKYAKPVQVELQFENLFDMLVACGDGRQEEAERNAIAESNK